MLRLESTEATFALSGQDNTQTSESRGLNLNSNSNSNNNKNNTNSNVVDNVDESHTKSTKLDFQTNQSSNLFYFNSNTSGREREEDKKLNCRNTQLNKRNSFILDTYSLKQRNYYSGLKRNGSKHLSNIDLSYASTHSNSDSSGATYDSSSNSASSLLLLVSPVAPKYEQASQKLTNEHKDQEEKEKVNELKKLFSDKKKISNNLTRFP